MSYIQIGTKCIVTSAFLQWTNKELPYNLLSLGDEMEVIACNGVEAHLRCEERGVIQTKVPYNVVEEARVKR